MGFFREGGIVESWIKRVSPDRVPKLLKRLRARAEKMREGPRKNWLLAKIKEWEAKPPEEVLQSIILVLIVIFGLAFVGTFIGYALTKVAD